MFLNCEWDEVRFGLMSYMKNVGKLADCDGVLYTTVNKFLFCNSIFIFCRCKKKNLETKTYTIRLALGRLKLF